LALVKVESSLLVHATVSTALALKTSQLKQQIR